MDGTTCQRDCLGERASARIGLGERASVGRIGESASVRGPRREGLGGANRRIGLGERASVRIGLGERASTG